jgi:hypothetical protein
VNGLKDGCVTCSFLVICHGTYGELSKVLFEPEDGGSTHISGMSATLLISTEFRYRRRESNSSEEIWKPKINKGHAALRLCYLQECPPFSVSVHTKNVFILFQLLRNEGTYCFRQVSCETPEKLRMEEPGTSELELAAHYVRDNSQSAS